MGGRRRHETYRLNVHNRLQVANDSGCNVTVTEVMASGSRIYRSTRRKFNQQVFRLAGKAMAVEVPAVQW